MASCRARGTRRSGRPKTSGSGRPRTPCSTRRSNIRCTMLLKASLMNCPTLAVGVGFRKPIAWLVRSGPRLFAQAAKPGSNWQSVNTTYTGMRAS
ncbi:hypothetical protein D3C72_2282940 [compost metagenome]